MARVLKIARGGQRTLIAGSNSNVVGSGQIIPTAPTIELCNGFNPWSIIDTATNTATGDNFGTPGHWTIVVGNSVFTQPNLDGDPWDAVWLTVAVSDSIPLGTYRIVVTGGAPGPAFRVNGTHAESGDPYSSCYAFGYYLQQEPGFPFPAVQSGSSQRDIHFEVVNGYTRYKCVGGLCQEFQTLDPNEGYETEAACIADCGDVGEVCSGPSISYAGPGWYTLCNPSGCYGLLVKSAGKIAEMTVDDGVPGGPQYVIAGPFQTSEQATTNCGAGDPEENPEPPEPGCHALRWFCNNGTSRVQYPCVGVADVCPDQGFEFQQECLNACADEPEGRWICEDGQCTHDPNAQYPVGFETQLACVIACASSSDCDLTGTISYDRVTGNQFRVSSTASGAQGIPTFKFMTVYGELANDTLTSALVNVPNDNVLNVWVIITDEACSVSREVVINTTTTGGDHGESPCALSVNLGNIDLGNDQYEVIAHTQGSGGPKTYTFLVDGSAVVPASGTPDRIRVIIPHGQTKTIAVAVFAGTCREGDTLTLSNMDGEGTGGNNGGGAPDPTTPDDGCAARLGIYYRDFKTQFTAMGQTIVNGRGAVEVFTQCTNPACEYWFQLFDSSDVALFLDYSDAAFEKHFPVSPEFGQSLDAFGTRAASYQVMGSALSRPASIHKHWRLKATPVFQTKKFDIVGDAVKIRPDGPRSLFVFTTDSARAYRWNAPVEGEYGAGSVETLVNLSNIDASDATDAALLDDKLYVIAPGELFVVDLNQGEATLNSGVRSETRVPSYVEVVGTKPLAIYQSDEATPKVRCYDLSFPAPKLVWSHNELITRTQVSDGNLLLASETKLLSSTGGTSAPTQVNTFDEDITTLAPGYVGLDDGTIHRLKSTGWQEVTELAGPAGALWPWLGGASEARALAGAASGTDANRLRAELPTLNWVNDIELTGATGVTAMRLASVEVKAATESSPAVIDEWMLIGDDNKGLWVYSRSPLSESDGAFRGCNVGALRLTPILGRVPVQV